MISKMYLVLFPTNNRCNRCMCYAGRNDDMSNDSTKKIEVKKAKGVSGVVVQKDMKPA